MDPLAPKNLRRGWRPDDRWACLAAYALLLVWCFPLYASPGARGSVSSDWEWFLAYFQVLRSTLLDHGQFPGTNPYNFLGTPLWGNPQIGPISHYTPLVLLLGPLLGVKLGIVVSYLLSFEAGRALGRRLFLATPLAPVLAGLLYALNTGMASHFTRGHICFGAYPLAPLLVLACLELPRRRWAGAAAGLVAGLMVHYGIHYYVVYVMSLCGLLALVVSARQRAGRALLRFSALGALAFLAVAGARLLPALAVMGDFPRKAALPIFTNLEGLRRMFLMPALGPPEVWLTLREPVFNQVSSWEFHAYAGVGVLALALLSLRWGLRFYHLGALLGLLLLLGSTSPWHPSYWLARVPPFDSIWLVFRWRLVVLACLALAAARGLDRLAPWLQQRLGARARRVLPLLAFALPLELVALLLPSWAAHVTPYQDTPVTRASLGLPDTPQMLALRGLTVPRSGKRVLFSTARANLGTVAGYEPLLGYRAVPSARLWVGHPRYRGEYTVDGQPVTPARWSPNRILLRDLPPGRQLELNLNPGRGWSAGGQPLCQRCKVFELDRPFRVTIPASGELDLRYTPPGLRAGLLVSLTAGLALLAWYWLERRRPSPRRAP